MKYGRCAIAVSDTAEALMSAETVLTIVPLALKRPIVTELLAHTQSTESLPGTVIQDSPGILFLDRDSAPAHLEP